MFASGSFSRLSTTTRHYVLTLFCILRYISKWLCYNLTRFLSTISTNIRLLYGKLEFSLIVYMLRPDLKLLTRFKAGRPNLKPVDPLPSRSTGFKTGQLILSHTWLFRNSACERFVRKAEGQYSGPQPGRLAGR